MSEVVAIRETALSFSVQKVQAVAAKIVAAFERRDVFETAQGTNMTKSAYITERNRMLKHKQHVARMFLACGVEPTEVIENSEQEGSMFSAYALKKITEISLQVCGERNKLESVVVAFFACAIIATDNGMTKINNQVNKRFLTNNNLVDLVKDKSLSEKLEKFQKKEMSGANETQSSQCRRVLEVLKLGEISTVHKNRDTVSLNIDSPYFAFFRSRYLEKAQA